MILKETVTKSIECGKMGMMMFFEKYKFYDYFERVN